MLVTSPTIARLMLRPRRWALRRIRAGDFGPIMRRRGRTLYVELDNVQARLGVSFPPEKLAALGVHLPPAIEEF